MNNKEEKTYVLYEGTLRSICEQAENTNEYEVELYSLAIDRSDISDEQRKKQESNKYAAKINADLYLFPEDEERVVLDELYNNVAHKEKNVLDKTYADMMDEKICVVATTRVNSDGKEYVWSMSTKIGEDISQFKDTKEFEKDAKHLYKTSFNGDAILVEETKVVARAWRAKEWRKEFKKLISKLYKENFTYCVKNGEVIVPDEYLAKGKEGIEEWRELRKSKNKSNSMENRMLKQIVRDKKQYAYEYMLNITNMNCVYTSWTVPFITIDGRYNKQRMNKLVNEVLGVKDNKNLIGIEKEDIEKLCKGYWKNMFKTAYTNIDNFVMPE